MLNKVGDYVRVINTGESYTTYYKWFYENVKDFDIVRRYDYGNAPSTSGCYTIVALAPHGPDNPTVLYAIEETNTKKVYLINVEGFEPYKWQPKLGELYYYVCVQSGNSTDYYEVVGCKFFSPNCSNDMLRLFCGNCYKTKEEAEEHREEWLKKLTPKYPIQRE